MSRRVCLGLVLLVLIAQFLPRNVQAQGQGVYGAITGLVTDPSGAAIPNAKIMATNVETGVQTAVESNNAGYYTVSSLIAGTYTVEISAAGFKVFRQENLAVTIGHTIAVDAALTVGNVQQEVTVSGAPPSLQTEKVEISGTITSRQLDSIPVAHNNATGFVKLLPGVMEPPGQSGLPSAGSEGYISVSVNGGRSQQNVQLLDGILNTEPIGGAANVVPPLDALESVTGNTSNYDVEFGQSQGLVTVMTTKSGSNRWHGTAYEFNQVNSTSARNPFTEPTSTSHFVWNQFGATAGGAIKKNKLFVFGGYQGVRIRSGAARLLTVPIAPFRNGDFSSLLTSDPTTSHPIYDPATGNADGTGRSQFNYQGVLNKMDPARIDPVSAKLLATIPLPNTGSGTDNNFIAALGSLTSDNSTFERVDYVVNESNRFFGRYTHNWQVSGCTSVSAFGTGAAPPLALPNCGQGKGSQDMIAVDFVHVFTPSFVVEARFGDMIYRFSQNALDQTAASSEAIGLHGLNDACPSCGGLAGFRIGGPVGGFLLGNTDHAHQVDNEGNYDYVGIATWTRGRHTVKFGTEIDFANDHRFDSSSQGDYGCWNASGVCPNNGFSQTITGASEVPGSGLSTASFLLGQASVFSRIIYANPLPAANQKRDAFYIQDTWHVTPKLTAVLGLRYDYIGYPTSPFKGGIANFNFTNTNTIIANYGNVGPTAGVENNWWNFAPRIGFAYKVLPGTVVRAGYAKSYPIGFYGANFGAITNDWPTSTRQTISQILGNYTPAITFSTPPASFVSGFDILAAAGNPGEYPTPSYSTAFGTDFHNPTNSVDQWNLTVEHDFGNNLTLSAAYVGNATRHLFYRVDHNAPRPGPTPTQESLLTRYPYAAYGYYVPAYDQTNQTSSGYNGLQINMVKRYSQGFTLTTAVTWSKAYDFGLHNAATDVFNSNLDRAVPDGERAMIISVGHVWDLPFGHGKALLSNSNTAVNLLVSGWKWSGVTRWMSGDAFSPVMGDTSSLNSPCCGLRPDRLGSGTVNNPTATKWFDPSAFRRPALYTFGNSGRNILRGPAFWDADWALARDFKINDQMRFEFQAQFLNALNHKNLGDPSTAIDSSTAGEIFGIVQNMRQLQLGVHFYW